MVTNLKFKSSGLRFTLPSGWHEVPYIKGLQIISSKKKDLEVMALLMKDLDGNDISLDKIKSSTDLTTIHYVKESLLFLKELPIKKYPEFPKKVFDIELPYVNYADHFDLGQCTVGQVEDMKSKLKNKKFKNDIETIEIFPVLCAIYLQPIIDNSNYDSKRINKITEKIEKELDFKTVINMGNFFLQRLHVLVNGQMKELRRAHSLRMRLRLAFSNLLQRLVSLLP